MLPQNSKRYLFNYSPTKRKAAHPHNFVTSTLSFVTSSGNNMVRKNESAKERLTTSCKISTWSRFETTQFCVWQKHAKKHKKEESCMSSHSYHRMFVFLAWEWLKWLIESGRVLPGPAGKTKTLPALERSQGTEILNHSMSWTCSSFIFYRRDLSRNKRHLKELNLNPKKCPWQQISDHNSCKVSQGIQIKMDLTKSKLE